jgi:hypothetical protein
MKEISRMNRTFLAACGAAVLSVALVSAQDKPSGDSNNHGSDSNAAANTVTFTGCLNPGSNQDSYYLTSAKQKGVKSTDKSVKIVAANPKVKLEPFVTQEVEVTGTVDQAAAAATPNADGGSQVRTVTVTKVKYRSQYCG